MRLLQPARVRPKDRVQTQTDKTANAAPLPFPAPIGGWVENQNLAVSAQGVARVMENAFPTLKGVRVRGGRQKVAIVGGRVRSLFTYRTGAQNKMFAATDTTVYDITGLNPASIPSALASGRTSGYYITEQMGTVGGDFLIAVNGSDPAAIYNGTTWVNASLTGVSTSTLSHVWKHKSRLYFVQKNSMTAWYLAVDSIGGALSSFSLAGVFQRGGSLLFGATWSQESGDGPSDRIVFVSTEGEVAVYQGSNPGNASDWNIVGVYNITKPMGQKCVIRAGGDLAIGTEAGIVPLSAVTQKDPASMDVSAVTAAIEPSWRREAKKSDGAQQWELVKWPRENMLLATLPHDPKTCFVANLQSGAWAKYVGWDVQCTALYNSQVYFGDSAGSIFAAEVGGSDDGEAYVVRISYMPSDLGKTAVYKSIGMMRATFTASSVITAQLSVSPDYAVIFPTLPGISAAPANAGALWGVALWGVALWGDDGNPLTTYSTGWNSVGAAGYALAPQVQMAFKGAGRPMVELLAIEALAELGGA